MMGVIVMAMFLGCIGTTTIKDINENPDYLGKEVTIEGTLAINMWGWLGEMTGDTGFVVRGGKKSLPGTYEEIDVKYRGVLPSRSKEGQPWVPRSKTKVRVVGIVRNKDPQVWLPYIEGISWEYVYRGKVD